MNEPGTPNPKPPMHLLPHVLEDGAEVMERGARKRRRANDWREGRYEISRFTDASQRHLEAFKRGEDLDDESGQPHLVHAFVNLMMAHELHRDRLGVDDRYSRRAALRPVE